MEPKLFTHAAVLAFCKFITARERHRVAKEGERAVDRPDPIISRFRFCNVRRNDDRVTRWIHENYLTRWRSDPDLWFALLVARLLNLPSSLDMVASAVLPFKPEKMRPALQALRADGQNVFNAAYIVSTNGHSMDKVDYVIDMVLKPAWERRKEISRKIAYAPALDMVHQVLCELNGMASFMAAQVVADLKYAEPERWVDFDTFAAPGPGSKRGLNRVMGYPVDYPLPVKDWTTGLLALHAAVNKRLCARGWKPITAQDIQNCLCEYDKYERFRTGEGRPKQLYKPKEN